MLHLVFEGLGAREVTSDAFADAVVEATAGHLESTR
jgi:hypothetical protein